MDYINHLDVINPEANTSIMANWSDFSKEQNNNSSLIEQLQTTLDVEQLLAIYLNALGSVYRVNAIELTTAPAEFSVGMSSPSHQKLTLPIRIDNKLMGKVSYYTDKRITDILMSSLTGFQRALVFPLRNALAYWQLQQLALKDALTGVGNRGMFDDTLTRTIQHANRYNEEFVLMMLDLDNFKLVNDRQGHQAGDRVLKGFCDLVEECLRREDQLFRFGGDEFAVLLNKQGLTAAKVVAARIHFAVANNTMLVKNGISTSIGCACFQQTDTTTSLFARADKALYAAKYAGKNCMKTA